MRAWKTVRIGAALGAVSIVAMSAVATVSNIQTGSAASAHVAATATADRGAQSIAVFTPITPAPSSAVAYGWGPFRTVDW